MPAPARLTLLKGTHARDEAVIDLLALIAAHGIVEEEGEVGDQTEVVAEAVRLNLAQRLAAAVLPFAADAVAIRVPAVGRVDGSETVDEPGVDRALR